jgi:transcriptional regulator
MPIYLPPHFEETDPARVRDLVEAFPLATIVTQGADGISANHIPMQLSEEAGGPLLRGHVARSNDVWRVTDPDRDVLVIFQSPDAYISPNWYPSKQATHRVVPTWNYAVVHMEGRVRFIEDERWLRGVIGKLTKASEAGQPTPWRMGQAPPDFTREQLQLIVGIEIEVRRIIAKFKTSQNRADADRLGAAAGVRPTNPWLADNMEPG